MKIGFIGGGNMASALIGGLINSGYAASDICLFDTDAEKCEVWQAKGVRIAKDAKETESISDLIIFAVKPNVIETVLREMKGYKDKIYLSIAAGVSIAFLEDILGKGMKVVRTMPNTPAQVGCGMTVVTPNSNLSETEVKGIEEIFSGIGDTAVMPEKFMSVATALHGSSPAYVYMFIDALADAGVSYGLSKEQALKLAAKAVEGSAKMVQVTGIHPEKLKDNVCSPGGTTIAAVCDLEENGFRAVVQSAVRACVDRAEEMSK
ncbi:MAG: pyrroline-5-carboxylate reductase [Clostridia bacterium]|nr:pyrroline-5-carboxylate reductase [Clostridia bacterium]